MAVAEFGRAKRFQSLGIGDELSGAECLHVLLDGILIRSGKGGGNDTQYANGKYR